jgi:methyl-accepting chemotaxis protein
MGQMWRKRGGGRQLAAVWAAVERTQAVIEFDLDGIVQRANDNFLTAMGYSAGEVVGKHHRMFVSPAHAASAEYAQLWADLRRGRELTAEWGRLAKGGREVWIQATYLPILDGRGQPQRVVKIATDITERKRESLDNAGQIAALRASHAVIEFAMDGTIRWANDNFLAATGYALDEIVGQHHRMFVGAEHAQSAAYAQLWADLNAGRFRTAEWRRFAKGGREIWIQASYIPIADGQGRPVKVVKYAVDITEEKRTRADHAGQIAAIDRAQAVVEFDLDGTIRRANPNFLTAMGYTAQEVVGRHHRMFVDPAEAQSQAYRQFWDKLAAGEFAQGQFRRLGKGGREIWIQAIYSPIADEAGKPFKVVKYASDITAQMAARVRAGELSRDTTANIDTVSAAAEEMTGSVQEIAGKMTDSRDKLTGMVERLQANGRQVAQLEETAASMGTIIEMIRKIAEKVNMLALNATIEAARAGAAGKGFAVVANEVKTLAGQTNQATDEVMQKIEGVQALVGEVAGQMTEIDAAAQTLSTYIGGVAGAIEQQTAATQEIAASLEHVSTGVRDLHACVDSLAGGDASDAAAR